MADNFLETKRDEIDEIDKKILSSLQVRFALMTEIAKYKRLNGMEIEQKEREITLLEHRKALATQLKIDEEFAEQLFRLIMEESKRIQKVA